MRTPKHLPENRWPAADREAFAAAFLSGDIFEDTGGPGQHLAEASRRTIRSSYGRWLGYLHRFHPDDLGRPPADRITRDRVRDYRGHLQSEVRFTSVGMAAQNLCYAARLIAPERDWEWLARTRTRLLAQANPLDRFDRLVPGRQTLDLGIELMDEAMTQPTSSRKVAELQYRDGLLLALVSLWPIRRRSLAALTVSRHVEVLAGGINILLYPEDTKSKRPESFAIPEPLIPYLKRYLLEIRPRILGRHAHDGLWASYKRRPLKSGRLYDCARKRVFMRFGKKMGLHDFRRSAATHLAIDAPEKVGLIAGVLQHSSPDIGDTHYNLSRAIAASRRFGAHRSKARERLQSSPTKRRI
jgi:integrase